MTSQRKKLLLTPVILPNTSTEDIAALEESILKKVVNTRKEHYKIAAKRLIPGNSNSIK